LEEYDDLVEYYSTLCTKQPMEKSNAKLNECWELVEAQFKEEMKKSWLHTREMKKSIEGTC
jgi:hypothetical protein